MPVSLSNLSNALAAQPNRFDYSDPDKVRGGYYTPEPLAAWLSRWAIRKPSDRVLEPSCGNGAFVVAASTQLTNLGCPAVKTASQITGVELIAREAVEAERRLAAAAGLLFSPAISTSDFFAWANAHAEDRFDVVLGNPPFIRYQAFPEPHRGRAMEWLERAGLKANRLTNIWVPFVVASVNLLKAGGRLAMVLPAELLQVGYAAQLRTFLAEHFEAIQIVACNELFFEKAEQEVVLLLADGARVSSNGAATRVRLVESSNIDDLITYEPQSLFSEAEEKTISHNEEKWLKCFLSNHEIGLMRALKTSPSCSSLARHARATVGIVTGRNEFFVLKKSQLKSLGLEEETLRIVSKASHLRGADFLDHDYEVLSEDDQRVYLLNLGNLPMSSLSVAAQNYVRTGEIQKWHKGYKCSIRMPWYDVPSIWTPDAFSFRQIYDFPRIVFNKAKATCTDTIHRIKVNEGVDPEKFCANTYTYLTAASAEIEGRSYGGGVLELEPSEAGRLLFPAELASAMPISEADRLIRAGRLIDVLEFNSKAVLQEGMGLSVQECKDLSSIWEKMRNRRHNRNRREDRVK